MYVTIVAVCKQDYTAQQGPSQSHPCLSARVCVRILNGLSEWRSQIDTYPGNIGEEWTPVRLTQVVLPLVLQDQAEV